MWQHCYNILYQRRGGTEKMHQGLNSQIGIPHRNPRSMLEEGVRELNVVVQLSNESSHRDASHGCQQEDKSKLFPVCNQEASMSQTERIWLFPCLDVPWNIKNGGTHRDQAFPKRYVPEGTTMSARDEFETLWNFLHLVFIQFPHIFFKNLLEKWKPLADKKSQTTSQRARTRSIKRQQIRAKLRRAYCVVYKNSGIEITSSSTDMTSWYTSEYWF